MTFAALIFGAIASFFLAAGAGFQAWIDYSDLEQKHAEDTDEIERSKRGRWGKAWAKGFTDLEHWYKRIRLVFAWVLVLIGGLCALVASILLLIAQR